MIYIVGNKYKDLIYRESIKNEYLKNISGNEIEILDVYYDGTEAFRYSDAFVELKAAMDSKKVNKIIFDLTLLDDISALKDLYLNKQDKTVFIYEENSDYDEVDLYRLGAYNCLKFNDETFKSDLLDLTVRTFDIHHVLKDMLNKISDIHINIIDEPVVEKKVLYKFFRKNNLELITEYSTKLDLFCKIYDMDSKAVVIKGNEKLAIMLLDDGLLPNFYTKRSYKELVVKSEILYGRKEIRAAKKKILKQLDQ